MRRNTLTPGRSKKVPKRRTGTTLRTGRMRCHSSPRQEASEIDSRRGQSTTDLSWIYVHKHNVIDRPNGRGSLDVRAEESLPSGCDDLLHSGT